jgi:hypothetical protein
VERIFKGKSEVLIVDAPFLQNLLDRSHGLTFSPSRMELPDLPGQYDPHGDVAEDVYGQAASRKTAKIAFRAGWDWVTRLAGSILFACDANWSCGCPVIPVEMPWPGEGARALEKYSTGPLQS